jgi:hypothetical protein
MHLTKLDFLNRFSVEEKVAILTAAESSAELKVYLFDFNNSDVIDLTDAETVTAVNMLETAGLIATGRAAEILTCPTDTNDHVLVLVSGTTFHCTNKCQQDITFSAFGEGYPSVDESGNPPLNPEQWMGPCETPN